MWGCGMLRASRRRWILQPQHKMLLSTDFGGGLRASLTSSENTMRIEIIHPCCVGGKARKVGDELEVSQEVADLLIGMGRALPALGRKHREKYKGKK